MEKILNKDNDPASADKEIINQEVEIFKESKETFNEIREKIACFQKTMNSIEESLGKGETIDEKERERVERELGVAHLMLESFAVDIETIREFLSGQNVKLEEPGNKERLIEKPVGSA